MKPLDLTQVEKPGRYLGGEMASIYKENAEIRFILAFPDVYEVGMSHLGLQILYKVLNDVEWIAAERAYAPWPDAEAIMRQNRTPLASLESRIPLVNAEVIGFTLQYELCATNILTMLDLAGLPLLAAERDESHPLIIGGGPCAYNPEPLADFFDLFLIGDGEEAVLEIATTIRDGKRDGISKRAILEELRKIPGVYVPSFFTVTYEDDGRLRGITPLLTDYPGVTKRFLADLETAAFPTSPVIPFLKTVHDRVSMEVSRGCTRGCRFCQAGYIYRPVRERSPERLLDLIDATLRNTGYEEISLLSLSTGDYRCINQLLKELMARYADDKVAVSLPSLRVGSLTTEVVEEIKKVRKTGFTLAPEAGSERLRNVINKGITEEDLITSAHEIYGSGWRLIKLYFMLGLPTENRDDLIAISDLARRVKSQARAAGSSGEVNVAVSTFVPKAHTPFQWEAQISHEETVQRLFFLKDELKKRKLSLKWQDPHLSLLEGVFARGDRRLSNVLLRAYRLGCRFDGWREHFDRNKWDQAFAEAGIDRTFYLRARALTEVLPWDHLNAGISKEFLLKERELSFIGSYTEDCRNGACTNCGVCDFSVIKPRIRQTCDIPSCTSPHVKVNRDDSSIHRLRLHFTKLGATAFLSHLELINLFTRAIRRAGIPIRYSQGFHPHPRFSFATALSVGVESVAEYFDMELIGAIPATEVKNLLNQVLPAGMEILAASEVPLNAPSLSVIMDKVRYRVTLPTEFGPMLPALCDAFMQKESFAIVRNKKRGEQSLDLRLELFEVSATASTLEMIIGRGKPLEFAVAITGADPTRLAGSRIEKVEVLFHQTDHAETYGQVL